MRTLMRMILSLCMFALISGSTFAGGTVVDRGQPIAKKGLSPKGEGPESSRFVGKPTHGQCIGTPEKHGLDCICAEVSLKKRHHSIMLKHRNGWMMDDSSGTMRTMVFKVQRVHICRWECHPDISLRVRYEECAHDTTGECFYKVVFRTPKCSY